MFKLPHAQRRIEKRQTAQVDEGVSITPMPITMEEEVTITYDGLLAQNNAQDLYLHVGSGESSNWDNVQDIKMKRVNKYWSTNLVPTDSPMHFCFHDGANHWDNNADLNWSVMIHNGQLI